MALDKNSQEIDQTAADWVARLDRAPLSAEENQSFQDWLGADPRHFGAYARAEAVFAHSERAKALGAGFDSNTFGLSGVEPAPARVRFSRRGLMMSGAAAAAVLVGAAGLSYTYIMPTRYQTRRGEVRLIPMGDGSVVTLNTASIIEVRYTPMKRALHLLEGEALFDVAKDPERPFVVTVGDTKVRAVGTSFAVRRLGTAPTEVLVREGIVDITRAGGTEALRAPANTRSVAVDTPDVAAKVVTVGLDAAAVARQLSWREGMIAFEGISLGQAAAEFRRYSDTRIIIDDPAVAAIPVTGLFSAYNPSGFAHAAATSFNLQVGMTPAGQVMLWK